MERFKKMRQLGDGSFGQVFKALDTQSNEVVAVKKFKQKYKTWEKCMDDPEVKALIKLVHPNIVKLKEVIRQSNTMFIIFELLNEDLSHLIKERRSRKQNFKEIEIANIIH